jgi:hypothetical protein
MKKKILIAIVAAVLVTAGLYAYNVGYCLRCNCHQYQGGPSWDDKCVCGHDRAEHS